MVSLFKKITVLKFNNNTEIELPKIKFTLEELKSYNFSVIDMAKIDELIQE